MIIHFQAGLPRSGSTLLTAILRQNPDIYTMGPSPLQAYIRRLQHEMHPLQQHYNLSLTDSQREAILEGLFYSMYEHESNKIIIDKSFLWPSNLRLLDLFFPNAKIICTVRSLNDVLNSFERNVQENFLTLHGSQIGGPLNDSVYTRVANWMAPTGDVGGSYDALKEAFYGPHSKKLFLLDYSVLVNSPHKAIDAIYDFVDLPRYTGHTFDNLFYHDTEYEDNINGCKNLHTIKASVKKIDQPNYLPIDIREKYQGSSFWNFPSRSPKTTNATVYA